MAIIDDVEYGPLSGLIGRWTGSKGKDLSPEPVGSEEVVYREVLTFEAAGWVKNAGQQFLAIVRYHQAVNRVDTGEGFHDQIGYWTWDAEAGTIQHSFTIPRGMAVLAGGKAGVSDTVLEVSSKLGDPIWGIVQSPYLTEKASTVAFSMKLVTSPNELSYSQTTSLKIYGRDFEHTDESVLVRS